MRVGLCGLGDRLGYLAEFCRRQIPYFELAAFVDPAPVGLGKIDSQHARRMKAYVCLRDMLESESLDLVMIGSPNTFHFEQLRLILSAGVRAFCEKPVVASEQQTFKLLRILRDYGEGQIIVGLVLRYAPLYVDLVGLAREFLGDIVSIEASELIDPAHGAFFFRDWRRKSELSGGFMLEKCCHDLDLYGGLVQSRATRVASFGGRSVFKEENRRLESRPVYHARPPRWLGVESAFAGDSDIIDHQNALIEYETGAVLSFHTNLHAAHKTRRFCIVGTEGMAEGEFIQGHLRVFSASTGKCVLRKEYSYDPGSTHYGAEQGMANALALHFERGDPLQVSVIHGLEAGMTALKIDQSRVTGEIVDLTDTWSLFDSILRDGA